MNFQALKNDISNFLSKIIRLAGTGVVLLSGILAGGTVWAVDYTYDGTWSSGRQPVLDAGDTVKVSVDVDLGDFEIPVGATLKTVGSITLNGNIKNYGDITVGYGNPVFADNLTLYSGSSLNSNEITFNGVVNFETGTNVTVTKLTLETSGSLTSAGTIISPNGIENKGVFKNAGEITCSSGGLYNSGTFTASGNVNADNLVNTGLLTVLSGADLTFDFQVDNGTDEKSGIINCYGTISANNFINNANSSLNVIYGTVSSTYAITNSGSITSSGTLSAQGIGNSETGTITNTGYMSSTNPITNAGTIDTSEGTTNGSEIKGGTVLGNTENTYIFTGTTDSDWSTDGNWLNGIASIDGSASAKVSLQADCVNSGDLTFNKSGNHEIIILLNGHNFEITGTMLLSSTGEFLAANNETHITIIGPGNFTVKAIDTAKYSNQNIKLLNNVTFTVTDEIAADLDNSHTFTVDGSDGTCDFYVPASGVNVNYGVSCLRTIPADLCKPYGVPTIYTVTTEGESPLSPNTVKVIFKNNSAGNNVNFKYTINVVNENPSTAENWTFDGKAAVNGNSGQVGVRGNSTEEKTLSCSTSTCDAGDGIIITIRTPDDSMNLAEIRYIQDEIKWTGKVDADITNLDNWTCDTVEEWQGASELVIPGSCPRYPVFTRDNSANAQVLAVNKLLIQNNASLVISGDRNLVVHGSIECQGTGKITAADGIVSFEGDGVSTSFKADYPEYSHFGTVHIKNGTSFEPESDIYVEKLIDFINDVSHVNETIFDATKHGSAVHLIPPAGQTVTVKGNDGLALFDVLDCSKAGGQTLNIDGTISVNTLNLSGTSATNRLSVTGASGKIKSSKDQIGGKYLSLDDSSVPEITDGTTPAAVTYTVYESEVTLSTPSDYSKFNDKGWLIGDPSEFVWLGKSTNWNAKSNWSTGMVPPADGSKINIPSGKKYYPVLSEDLNLGTGTTISVSDSALIDVASYNLTAETINVDGKIRISGNKTQSINNLTLGTDAVVECYGNSTVATSILGTAGLKNFRVAENGNVNLEVGRAITINQNIEVLGSLNISDNFTLGTGGKISGSGKVNFNNNFVLDGGSVSGSAGSELVFKKDFTWTSGTISGFAVKFEGLEDQVISGTSITFADAIVSKAGGKLTFSGGTTFTKFTEDSARCDYVFDGDIVFSDVPNKGQTPDGIITTGTVYTTNNCSSLSRSSGALLIRTNFQNYNKTESGLSFASDLNIMGNFTDNGKVAAGKITLNGTEQKFTASEDSVYDSISVFSGTTTFTNDVKAALLSVNTDAVLKAGNDENSPINIKVEKTLTVNGNFTQNKCTVTFTGGNSTEPSSFVTTAAAAEFYNLTIDKDTYFSAGDKNLTVSNNFVCNTDAAGFKASSGIMYFLGKVDFSGLKSFDANGGTINFHNYKYDADGETKLTFKTCKDQIFNKVYISGQVDFVLNGNCSAVTFQVADADVNKHVKSFVSAIRQGTVSPAQAVAPATYTDRFTISGTTAETGFMASRSSTKEGVTGTVEISAYVSSAYYETHSGTITHITSLGIFSVPVISHKANTASPKEISKLINEGSLDLQNGSLDIGAYTGTLELNNSGKITGKSITVTTDTPNNTDESIIPVINSGTITVETFELKQKYQVKNTGKITASKNIVAGWFTDDENPSGTLEIKDYTGAADTSGLISVLSTDAANKSTQYKINIDNSDVTVSGNFTVTDFVANTKMAGKSLTLSGSKVSVTNQLLLSGSEGDGNLLSVTGGTGDGFVLASDKTAGSYLIIGPDIAIYKESNGSYTIAGYKYKPTNSVPYVASPTSADFGEIISRGWIIKSLSELTYTWQGDTSGHETEWGLGENWDIGFVPGIAYPDGILNSVGAIVVIPDGSPEYPETGDVSYTLSSLTIGTSGAGTHDAEIKLGGTGNLILENRSVPPAPVTGTLKNYGKIVYASSGRILGSGGGQSPIGVAINDDENGGTVEYTGDESGTIANVSYYNLLISSGDWTNENEVTVAGDYVHTGGSLKSTSKISVTNDLDISDGSIFAEDTLSAAKIDITGDSSLGGKFSGDVKISSAVISAIETNILDITGNIEILADKTVEINVNTKVSAGFTNNGKLTLGGATELTGDFINNSDLFVKDSAKVIGKLTNSVSGNISTEETEKQNLILTGDFEDLGSVNSNIIINFHGANNQVWTPKATTEYNVVVKKDADYVLDVYSSVIFTSFADFENEGNLIFRGEADFSNVTEGMTILTSGEVSFVSDSSVKAASISIPNGSLNSEIDISVLAPDSESGIIGLNKVEVSSKSITITGYSIVITDSVVPSLGDSSKSIILTAKSRSADGTAISVGGTAGSSITIGTDDNKFKNITLNAENQNIKFDSSVIKVFATGTVEATAKQVEFLNYTMTNNLKINAESLVTINGLEAESLTINALNKTDPFPDTGVVKFGNKIELTAVADFQIDYPVSLIADTEFKIDKANFVLSSAGTINTDTTIDDYSPRNLTISAVEIDLSGNLGTENEGEKSGKLGIVNWKNDVSLGTDLKVVCDTLKFTENTVVVSGSSILEVDGNFLNEKTNNLTANTSFEGLVKINGDLENKGTVLFSEGVELSGNFTDSGAWTTGQSPLGKITFNGNNNSKFSTNNSNVAYDVELKINSPVEEEKKLTFDTVIKLNSLVTDYDNYKSSIVFNKNVDFSESTAISCPVILAPEETDLTLNGTNLSFTDLKITGSVIISGSNTYTKLTAATDKSDEDSSKHVDMGEKIIKFGEGTTQIITGSVMLKGTVGVEASGDRPAVAAKNLKVCSTVDNSSWKILVNKDCTDSQIDIQYVDLKDSYNNELQNKNYKKYLFLIDGKDSGNNKYWNVPGQTYTWKGGTTYCENDWNTAANWEENSIPGIGAVVTIPAGKNYYPLLSENLTMNEAYKSVDYKGSVAVASGAMMDLAGKNVTAGTIKNNGTVYLEGVSGQIVKADIDNGTADNGGEGTVVYYGDAIEEAAWGNKYGILKFADGTDETEVGNTSHKKASGTLRTDLTINGTTDFNGDTSDKTMTLSGNNQFKKAVTINTDGSVTINNESNGAANNFAADAIVRISKAVDVNIASDGSLVLAAGAGISGDNITLSTLNVYGAATLNGNVSTAGGQTYNSKLTFTGNVTLEADTLGLNCGEISAGSNSLIINAPVTLGTDLSITAGSIEFKATLDGTAAVKVTGDVTAYKNITAASIEVTGKTKYTSTDSTVEKIITTSGIQKYNDEVTLDQDKVIFAAVKDGTDNEIAFAKDINGKVDSVSILQIDGGNAFIGKDVTVNTEVINNSVLTCSDDGGITFKEAYTGTLAVFNAGSGTITFNKNVDLSGTTLNAADGTVVLAPAGEVLALSGDSTFNKMKITGSVNIDGSNNYAEFTAENLGGKTLTFKKKTTQTITGKLTLKGTDTDNLLKLRSSEDETQWKILNDVIHNDRAIAYVDVKDSDNITDDFRFTATGNSIDSGNNRKWNFIGLVYVWTGAAHDHNWFTAENWDNNSVPGIGAIAEIPPVAEADYPILEAPLLTDESETASIGDVIGAEGKIKLTAAGSKLDLQGFGLTAGLIENNGRIRLTGSQIIDVPSVDNKSGSVVEYYGDCSSIPLKEDYANLEFTGGAKGEISGNLTVSETTLFANGENNSLTLRGNNTFTGKVTLGETSEKAGTLTINSISDVTITDGAEAKSINLTAADKTVKLEGSLEAEEAAAFTAARLLTTGGSAGSAKSISATELTVHGNYENSGYVKVSADVDVIGSIKNTGSYDAKGNVSLTGDFTDTTGTWNAEDKYICLNGNGNQNFNSNPATSYNEIKVEKTAGDAEFIGKLKISGISRGLSLNSANNITFKDFVDIQSYSDTSAAGNITFTEGGVIRTDADFTTTGFVQFNSNSSHEFTFDNCDVSHTAGKTILYGKLSSGKRKIKLAGTDCKTDIVINCNEVTFSGNVNKETVVDYLKVNGNVKTKGTVVITPNLILNGSFGGDGKATVDENLYVTGENSSVSLDTVKVKKDIIIDAHRKINTSGTITTKHNFVLYRGDITAAARSMINAEQDMLLLGSAYDVADSATGIDDEYKYQQTRLADYNYKRSDFNDQTLTPEGTALSKTAAFNSSYTAGDGSVLRTGKNFYANGLSLTGAAGWYVDIPENADAAVCFAEIYNSEISNAHVRFCNDGKADTNAVQNLDKSFIPAYNCNISAGSGWDKDDFEIHAAYTVRDDVIYVEFTQPVRNLHGEINGKSQNENDANPSAISHFTYSSGNYTEIYTDPDCQTVWKGDISQFRTDSETGKKYYYVFLKADGKWNTDATGTSAGDAASTDRTGAHKTAIPYIDIARGLAGKNYIVTDKWGKRLENYSTSTAAPGTSYTDTEDKTGPVLYSVRTGQELHESDITIQKASDSHNFIEFRYSEKVYFDGTESDDLLNNETQLDNIDNVRVTPELGALSGDITKSGKLNFAGLGTVEKGLIHTGTMGKTSNTVNALYRKNFHTINLSIAGWTDGTVTDYDGNIYRNWIGYIEKAEMPSGKVNINTYNDKYLDLYSRKVNTKVFDEKGNYQEVYAYAESNTIPSVNSTESELYGNWDISEPVFAPLRDPGTAWNYRSDENTGYYGVESIGNTNGTGSTLDRIEFHIFDNKPSFDPEKDKAEWVYGIGWVNPGSEGTKEDLYLKDLNFTHSADITGGARQFDTDASRRTTGGVRYSSVRDSSRAFMYSTNPNETPSTPFKNDVAFESASATVFTGSSSPRQAIPNHESLYFALPLTDLALEVNTTFSVQYDDSKAYITDLAGNRLRSFKFKTIDRTPPSFNITLAPVSQDRIQVIFVKPITHTPWYQITDESKYEIDETDLKDLLPLCFDIIEIDAAGNAIEQDSLKILEEPARKIEMAREDRLTAYELKLNRPVTVEDVKKLYIRAILPKKYADINGKYSIDPVIGQHNSPVTLIQDSSKNYMEMYTAHALSDFIVGGVKPLYGYDPDMADEDGVFAAQNLYSSEEGSWAVHDWNRDQSNYGTLPADRNLKIVADIEDGTEENTIPPQYVRMYLSAKPEQASVSVQLNDDLKADYRIWLPDVTRDAFATLSQKNNTNWISVDGTVCDKSETPQMEFDLTKEFNSANFKAGDQVSFLFGLMNDAGKPVTIWHSPEIDIEHSGKYLASTTRYPLYILRLENEQDISSIDLWSFKLKSNVSQRGGVSILNNVINAENGEKTVLKVDVAEEGRLMVMVMTMDGSIVTYLSRDSVAPGEHYYTWDGKNNGGKAVARGIYFIRVIGNGIDETRKVLVVK